MTGGRKTAIFSLLLITIGLGGLAIYLGIQTTQNQNTEDTSADITNTGGVCNSSGTCTVTANTCIAIHKCDSFDSQGNCTVANPTVERVGDRASWNAQEIADGSCKYIQLDVLPDTGTNCSTGNIADTTQIRGHALARPNSASCSGGGNLSCGSTNQGVCFTRGADNNQGKIFENCGTYGRQEVAGSCGANQVCCGFNINPPIDPPVVEERKLNCGESCNSDSDCLGGFYSGTEGMCVDQDNNGTKECVSRTCYNSGSQTQPGRNCSCNGNNRTCGQRCGVSYALCSSGFECGYVLGPSGRNVCNASLVGTDNQRCLPQNESTYGYSSNGYKRQWCQDQLAYTVVTSLGSPVSGKTTDQIVAEVCTPTVTNSIWCSRCTPSLGDQNMCEVYQESDASLGCQAGYTRYTSEAQARTSCAQSAGGSCPITPITGPFTILKTATESCNSTTNVSTVNFTITIRNISASQAVFNFVEDTFDSRLLNMGTSPTSITPAGATISSNTIRWTGSTAERTLGAGATMIFSYRFEISSANRSTLGYITNTALLNYDSADRSGNVISYTIQEPLDCTTTTIPITGIFDEDSRWLLSGLTLMLTAVVAYYTGLGKKAYGIFSHKVLYTLDHKAGYENKVLLKFNKKNKK